jgi:hypothetical protein
MTFHNENQIKKIVFYIYKIYMSPFTMKHIGMFKPASIKYGGRKKTRKIMSNKKNGHREDCTCPI